MYIATHDPKSETGNVIVDIFLFQATYIYADILFVFVTTALVGVPLTVAVSNFAKFSERLRHGNWYWLYVCGVIVCLLSMTAVTWSTCEAGAAPYKAMLFGCKCARDNLPVFPAMPLLVYYMSGVFIAMFVHSYDQIVSRWVLGSFALLLSLLRLPLTSAWDHLWANLDVETQMGKITRFPPSFLWVVGNGWAVFLVTGLCYLIACESLRTPWLYSALHDVRRIGRNSLVYLVISSLPLYAVHARKLSVPECYALAGAIIAGISFMIGMIRK